jgi:hypothetical protein
MLFTGHTLVFGRTEIDMGYTNSLGGIYDHIAPFEALSDCDLIYVLYTVGLFGGRTNTFQF